MNSLHKRPVTRHFFPFDDVIHSIHIDKYFTASTLTTFQVLLAGFALDSVRLIYYYQISRKISSMRRTKSQTLKCFAYRLAAAFAQSNEARCYVAIGDVVGEAPTGDATTTSKSSKSLLPTELLFYVRGLTVPLPFRVSLLVLAIALLLVKLSEDK